MSPGGTEPTPQQIKAVASSLRLRILLLCNDQEWTNKERAGSGGESNSELARFHLHLDDAAPKSFVARFKSLIEEFRVGDAARNGNGGPGHGGIFILHRLLIENLDDS